MSIEKDKAKQLLHYFQATVGSHQNGIPSVVDNPNYPAYVKNYMHKNPDSTANRAISTLLTVAEVVNKARTKYTPN